MTIREQVAEAICGAALRATGIADDSWAEMPDATRNFWREEADDILKLLRVDPGTAITAGLVPAGLDRKPALQIWKGMLTNILAERDQ